MKNILLIISILISLIASSQTNYYVKNGGSDAANGLSDGTAWETIEHVNSQSFSAGDSILFNKGDIWRGTTLTPSSTGTISDYITYSSYGTGAKPRLMGSKGVTDFSPHPTLTDVYVCDDTMAINPYAYTGSGIYEGSIWYIKSDTIEWGNGNTNQGQEDYMTSVNLLTSNYQWTWNNDSLYFYYDGDISDIDTVEATQIARGINVGGEYVTIDGLHLTYFGSRCIGHPYSNPEVTKQCLDVRNCDLSFTSSKNEGVGFGLSLVHSNCLIEYNEIHANGRRNISMYIDNSNSTATIRDNIFQNNHIYDSYHTYFDMACDATTAQISNIIIRNNLVEDFYLVDKTGGLEANGLNLINNSVLGNFDSIFIYNNVFRHFTSSCVYTNQVSNLYVIYNTIINTSPSSDAMVYHPNIGGTQGNETIMNNIMAVFEPASFINSSSDGSLVIDTLNYNLLYNPVSTTYLLEDYPDGSDRVQYSEFYTTYNGLGFGLNSVYDELPQFEDSINDARLKSTSPAIGVAQPISFITTDILGNTRSLTAPTMGAYEFSGIDSTATDILTFTIPGQVSSVVNNTLHTVLVTVLNGTNVTSLTPTITLSPLATVSPLSGVAENFTSAVTYTVTANKGNTQDYEVTVVVQVDPPSENILYYKNSDILYRLASGEYLGK